MSLMGSNQGVSRAAFLLEVLWKCFLAFLASRGHLHSLTLVPASLQLLLDTSSLVTSSLILTLWLPSQKDCCDYTGPTQIIQDNLLIPKSLAIIFAKPFLPCKLTYPQVQVLDFGHYWGPLFSLQQSVWRWSPLANLLYYRRWSLVFLLLFCVRRTECKCLPSPGSVLKKRSSLLFVNDSGSGSNEHLNEHLVLADHKEEQSWSSIW